MALRIDLVSMNLGIAAVFVCDQPGGEAILVIKWWLIGVNPVATDKGHIGLRTTF
uniref:Uncharacterized protein n=1 Tax=Brassica oleracea TaxID=3712 RepID=A0A3P6F4Y8_BRAOL|nr:unnamed protein product [Brassica oleracea]